MKALVVVLPLLELLLLGMSSGVVRVFLIETGSDTPNAAVSLGFWPKNRRMDSEPSAEPVVSWGVKASQVNHSNTFQLWQGWQKHLHI